ncbi:phosphatase PAP2 family protein [Leifsonia shinshuensis]|uniref:Membrane-associated phospholipid phosphatase n=1 Tax=Leifsonia shinshuensis TaxID=150026 RepID=A0A853CPG3_9MICO|nr:phosphatase PAP2 family protein [Leifsonia shinshuensis]NYJ21803.1 membrane-associated phospholipid phosphatase [Leifsonia shinshuensis]
MRPAPLRLLPFVWGALGTTIVFTGVYLFFVRTYMGQVLDERSFAGADVWKGDLIDFAHAFLNALPAAAVVIGAIIAVVIVLVRRNWLVFIIAVIAAVAANVSTQVLKYSVLSRPSKGVDAGLANSLPSGHTAVAASAALVVFLVASPRYRPLAAVVGSVFTIAAGASTLVEQWHRPSDVIAGMLVVAFWGCIAGIVVAGLRLSPADPPVRSKLWALVWIAAACGVWAAIALIVTYTSTQNGTEHLFIAYAGGVSAIAATSFLLAAIGNRLYRALA